MLCSHQKEMVQSVSVSTITILDGKLLRCVLNCIAAYITWIELLINFSHYTFVSVKGLVKELLEWFLAFESVTFYGIPGPNLLFHQRRLCRYTSTN